MKRIFSLILAALLLAGTITGCGDTAEETTAAAIETQPVETESETLFMEDNLPEDLDFGGTAVNTFGWEEVAIIEFFAEEMNGNVVNDAVFQRNQVVEERLNAGTSLLKRSQLLNGHRALLDRETHILGQRAEALIGD